ADLVSVDFFVVPTATFRVLYMFVVLLHHRRRVVHFNVPIPPLPPGRRSKSSRHSPMTRRRATSLRDRDNIYGCEFRRRVGGMAKSPRCSPHHALPGRTTSPSE